MQVDTSSAKMLLSKLSGNDQLLLEQILAGGLATEERKARWTKVAPKPCCHCKQEADTTEHRWWKCPYWQHYRLYAPVFKPEWPSCFKHCGLPTYDMQMDTSTLAVVHTMMLNIQKQLNFLENQPKEMDPDPSRPRKIPRLNVGHCGNGLALGSGGVTCGGASNAGAGDGGCDSYVPQLLGNYKARSTLSHSSAQGYGKLPGPKEAALPRAIELPPNVVMAVRMVAGFGARHVVRCTICCSVGQLTSPTRFAKEHTGCTRKRGRARKLRADEKRLFASQMRGLSSWRQERARRWLVNVA